MKLEGFKQLIKEAVREAFKEEIKDILLEAVRSKGSPLNENFEFNQPIKNEKKSLSPKERHAMFGNILGEIKEGKTITTETFVPRSIESSINGELPAGEVSLDQIANLMNPKK